jgi:hypothetical protein
MRALFAILLLTTAAQAAPDFEDQAMVWGFQPEQGPYRVMYAYYLRRPCALKVMGRDTMLEFRYFWAGNVGVGCWFPAMAGGGFTLVQRDRQLVTEYIGQTMFQQLDPALLVTDKVVRVAPFVDRMSALTYKTALLGFDEALAETAGADAAIADAASADAADAAASGRYLRPRPAVANHAKQVQ